MVKLDELIVEGFIGSLKVAVTILFKSTSIALFDGSVEITIGAITVPVVNVQT